MTDPVKIIVGEGSITEVNVPEYNLIQTGGGGGGSGSDGATFFPEVSEEGVISWTNDGGYDNPEPVNIKGPAGNDGNDGNDGEDGTTFTPAVDASGNLSWTNDGGKQNPQTVNIKGPTGNDGSDGEDGADGVSPTVTFSTITGGHTMTVTDKDHPEGQSINIMDGTSGGGGTSDYDDLTDKPSINDVTLSGNKTAAQLGLGTYSKPSGGIPQTDFASAVQSKLDNTVVVSDTQPTATENKLWVDTDASAGSSYQVPTVAEMEAADNAILGNLASKIGVVSETPIVSGDDLNNYTQSGYYRTGGTLPTNAPSGTTWAVLQVLTVGTTRIQIIYKSDYMYMRTGNSTTWYNWYRYAGTQV